MNILIYIGLYLTGGFVTFLWQKKLDTWRTHSPRGMNWKMTDWNLGSGLVFYLWPLWFAYEVCIRILPVVIGVILWAPFLDDTPWKVLKRTYKSRHSTE